MRKSQIGAEKKGTIAKRKNITCSGSRIAFLTADKNPCTSSAFIGRITTGATLRRSLSSVDTVDVIMDLL
jgi:hypothetical protein